MATLEALAYRYFTHPDEGGGYLSVGELNELCHLLNCEIKQLHHAAAVKQRRAFRAERAEQDAKREIERLTLIIEPPWQSRNDNPPTRSECAKLWVSDGKTVWDIWNTGEIADEAVKVLFWAEYHHPAPPPPVVVQSTPQNGGTDGN